MSCLYQAALLTDNEQARKSKKLKLAMAWNKYDIVTKEILTNQTVADWPARQLYTFFLFTHCCCFSA